MRGAADPEIRQRITAATFVRQPMLPPARKYKVVQDFGCMVGFVAVQVKAGQVVGVDAYERTFLEQLHVRGCLLKPLPDDE